MKNQKNLETRLEQLAQAVRPDDSFVQSVMSRLETSSDTVQKPTPTFVRRFLMKPFTKFAAAAVLVFAVLIGINQFGISIDGAGVVWAQVVEELNHYERYKRRDRVVRENGPQVPTMTVYHWNLSLRRQEVEDGTIHIIDMRGEDAITVELHPDKKKAVVTKLLDSVPAKTRTSSTWLNVLSSSPLNRSVQKNKKENCCMVSGINRMNTTILQSGSMR
jgi:hypothetical protein